VGSPLKGTVSPVLNCLKVMSLKSGARFLKFLFNSLFHSVLAFEVLMGRLQNHSNNHFYFEYVRECSVRIQICSMRIQNTPGTISARLLCSYWLIQGEVDLIG
jgi:hypothetical protein